MCRACVQHKAKRCSWDELRKQVRAVLDSIVEGLESIGVLVQAYHGETGEGRLDLVFWRLLQGI